MLKSQDIQIREIRNDFSGELTSFILGIQRGEFNIAITAADQPDLSDIEAFYFGGGGAFWGAFAGGEMLGTIALVKFDEDAAAIRKMFVKKEYRGKELAIARLLLEKLFSYSHQQGIKSLYLGTVQQLQAAIRFYEKNGFERIDADQLPKLFPRMPVDTEFFTRRLKYKNSYGQA